MSWTLCKGDPKTSAALASQCWGLRSQTKLSDVILLFFLNCHNWTKIHCCRSRRPKMLLKRMEDYCYSKDIDWRAATVQLPDVLQKCVKNNSVCIGRHYQERKALAKAYSNSLKRESGKLKHNTGRWNQLFQIMEQVCGKEKNPEILFHYYLL